MVNLVPLKYQEKYAVKNRSSCYWRKKQNAISACIHQYAQWDKRTEKLSTKTKMITRIKTVDEIKPMYKAYLDYMRQFFKIYNFDSWYKSALKNLQRYTMVDDRYIYILKQSESIIGFALVNKHFRFNTDGFAIAEFYIQKDHERKGYGRKLAEHVFSQFSGNWEVAVTLKNKTALMFWEQVVSSYTKGKLIKKKNASFNGYGFVFNTADKP